MNDMLFAQFCDDVRQEDNGKWLLVGCYGDTMLVESFPHSTAIRAFLSFDHMSDFSEISLRLKLTSGATITEAKMSVAENPYGEEVKLVRAQVPTPPFKINLSREDEVVLEMWVDDEEPREAGRLKIEAGPDRD